MPATSSPAAPPHPATFTLLSVGIFGILTAVFGLTIWLLITVHSYQTNHGSLAILGMDQPASTAGSRRAVLELLAPSYHLLHQLGVALSPLRPKPWRPTGSLTQLTPGAKITTINGMPLVAGEYLLLAHCSHQHLRIRQHHNLQVKLSQLTFIPPKLPPHEVGTLTIHCDRLHPGMFHQTLTNIYKLYLLHGHWRLFIQTAPYEIASHHDLTVHLAALKVQTPQLQDKPAADEPSMILSAQEDTAPHFFLTRAGSTGTMARPLDEWTYLLPGTYTITINGTQQTLELVPGQAQTIALGQLAVHLPTSVDLKAYAITTGRPFSYELITPAGRHHLYPNTNYMLLSGEYRLGIYTAHHHWPIVIKPHRRTQQTLHALTVHNACSPPQPCAQTTAISLFHDGAPQPILQAPSDVPIFFAHSDLTLTTHRSLGLQTPLTLPPTEPTTPSHLHLTLGAVTFLAQMTDHPTKTTELVRIEPLGAYPHDEDQAINMHPGNYSEDIRRHHARARDDAILLFPGQYQLVAYEAHTSPHGFTKQRTELMTFTVRAQEFIQLNYPVYRRDHPSSPDPASGGR